MKAMTNHMEGQALRAVGAAVCIAVLIWNPAHSSGAWMLIAAFFFGAMFGQSIKALLVEGHLLRLKIGKEDSEYILGND